MSSVTPDQTEEVSVPTSVDVQPEPAVEASEANDKVSEQQQSSEADKKKPAAEESNELNEAESKAEVVEPAVSEKPAAVGSEPTEKVESSEAEAADKTDEAEKVVETDQAAVTAESQNGEATHTNGKHLAEGEKKVEEPVEDTNGVCKRKAENGSEVVEDEKSPKKAKVVDDGDQAPVEETAA